MTVTRVTAVVALLVCCASPAGAQAVKLEFHDGKVNLNAQNASIRAILTEWARLGGTQVINAERLGGAPLTLQLTDVAETQALDIVLRGNAGYIAGLRPGTAPIGGRSALDRIMVVPTAGTSLPVAARPATTAPAFTSPQPRVAPPPDPDDDPVSDVPPDDEPPRDRGGVRPAVPVNRGLQAPPQPFQTFQPQDDDAPQPTNTNTPVPGNPFGIQSGSPRPGTISPVPSQPNQRPPGQRPDAEP